MENFGDFQNGVEGFFNRHPPLDPMAQQMPPSEHHLQLPTGPPIMPSSSHPLPAHHLSRPMSSTMGKPDGVPQEEQAIQAEIARIGSHIVRGFPLASLTPVAEVANHLSVLAPFPSTSFPTSTSPYAPSRSSGAPISPLPGQDPLMQDYLNEITVLNQTSFDEDEMRYVDGQVQAMERLLVEEMRQNGPSLSFKQPPYPLQRDLPTSTSLPAGYTSKLLAHTNSQTGALNYQVTAPLLDRIGYPYPSFVPPSNTRPTSSQPSPARTNGGPMKRQRDTDDMNTSSDPRTFFETFLKQEIDSHSPKKLKIAMPTQHTASSSSLSSLPPSSSPFKPPSAPIPPTHHPKQSQHKTPDSNIASSPDPLGRSSATPTSMRKENDKPRKPRLVPGVDFYVEIVTPSVPSSQSQERKKQSPSKEGRRSEIGDDGPAFYVEIPETRKLEKMRKNGGGKKKVVIKDQATIDALEKLTDFIEDIFEAEDNLIPDTSGTPWQPRPSSSSNRVFLPVEFTSDAALLSPSSIRKLSKLVMKTSSMSRDALLTVETDYLLRLLKILERSLKKAEDLKPIPDEILARRHVPTSDDQDVGGAGEGGSGKGSVKRGRPSLGSGRGKKGKGKLESPLDGKRGRGSSKSVDRPMDTGDDVEAEDPDQEEDYTPTKPSTKRKRSRSRTPKSQPVEEIDGGIAGFGRDDEDGSPEGLWNDEVLGDFEEKIRVICDALLAAESCLVLLTGARLPKQLYSEDLISSALLVVKQYLSSVIYPFSEIGRDVNATVMSYPLTIPSSRSLINELFQAMTSVLPQVMRLLQQEDMPEGIVIQAVYIGIGPFFVEPSGAGSASGGTGSTGKGRDKDNFGAVAMKEMRSTALSLTKTVFAKYADQRQWIIDEILTSLNKLPDTRKGKGQFRLSNGRAIHTFSALVLCLVQSCASGVGDSIRYLLRRKEKVAEDAMDEDDDNVKKAGGEEESSTPSCAEELREVRVSSGVIKGSIESATKAAKSVVLYLLKRCGKAGKGSIDSDYKAILENFVNDLLSVLYLPEWPSAEFTLNIGCKSLSAALDDPKASADVTAIKNVSLDLLGVIGARLCQDRPKEDRESPLKSLQEAVAQGDTNALNTFCRAQSEILASVHSSGSDEDSAKDAYDFLFAQWGFELCQACKLSSATLRKLQSDPTQGAAADAAVQVDEALSEVVKRYWTEDPKSAGSMNGSTEHVVASLTEMQSLQGIGLGFDPILKHVLVACESPSVTFRTKALRALGLIVHHDSDIFLQESVRHAIEGRLLDSSPAVRDASVELLGKYVVHKPALALKYLPRISERIADTGVSVRKRVIKLLRSIYHIADEENMKIDIGKRLVLRILDEDTGVKDLARETIEELWFPESRAVGKSQKGKLGDIDDQEEKLRELSPAARAELTSKAVTIMGVAAAFKDRTSPLEDMLKQVVEKQQEKSGSHSISRLQEISDTLIDVLVESSSGPDFSLVDCIRTIYILTTSHPSIMSSSRANMLLPYLKSTTSAEEQVICEYLLKIFKTCIADLPKSASKFSMNLQAALLPMINKPSGGGSTTLQEVVACFCAVVHGQTKDFTRLCLVFKTVHDRLQAEVQAATKLEQPTLARAKGIPLLCYLVSSLCEHGRLDELRVKEPGVGGSLNSVTKGPINEHVLNLIVEVYQLSAGSSLQSVAMQCLGCLFRGHPQLMLRPASVTIMDQVFASEDRAAHAQLLKIIQDFLVSQSTAKEEKVDRKTGGKAAKDTAVDMNALIGNLDGFADSGVSSSVVQRYLSHILQAALGPSPACQRSAVEIIGCTVKQGLAHPIQCMPVIIALETSKDEGTVSRVFALHSILHTKHSGLIHSRFLEAARESFNFQSRLDLGGLVEGYRGDPPQALLYRWYGLLRDKRQWRLDFLRAMTKAFSVETGDIDFARYIAENLAAFEYKSQEEVLGVVTQITAVLSVAGMQVFHLLEAEEAPKMSLDDPPVLGAPEPGGEHSVAVAPNPSIIRASVVFGIALILKDHLKRLYNLSEAKCSSFVPGKKTAQGDKPAVRKDHLPVRLDYTRLPYAVRSLETVNEQVEQRRIYLNLISSDGTLDHPIDADADADNPDM